MSELPSRDKSNAYTIAERNDLDHAWRTGRLIDREDSPEPGAQLVWLVGDTIVPLEFGDE